MITLASRGGFRKVVTIGLPENALILEVTINNEYRATWALVCTIKSDKAACILITSRQELHESCLVQVVN
jgi:hypothetical protein